MNHEPKHQHQQNESERIDLYPVENSEVVDTSSSELGEGIIKPDSSYPKLFHYSLR